MQQPNEPDTEPDFESYGARLAYLHHKHGAERIHQGMTVLAESGRIPRQYLEMVAAVLRAAPSWSRAISTNALTVSTLSGSVNTQSHHTMTVPMAPMFGLGSGAEPGS
jgi:hypothetical protein